MSYKAETVTFVPSVDGSGTSSRIASNPKLVNILRRVKEHSNYTQLNEVFVIYSLRFIDFLLH